MGANENLQKMRYKMRHTLGVDKRDGCVGNKQRCKFLSQYGCNGKMIVVIMKVDKNVSIGGYVRVV